MTLIIPILIVTSVNAVLGRHGHGMRHRSRLMEPAEWGARPENAFPFSDPTENDDETSFPGFIGGERAYEPNEYEGRNFRNEDSWRSPSKPHGQNRNRIPIRGNQASASNDDQEPEAVPSTDKDTEKFTNKWGFNKDCQVTCKKLLCLGYGPFPEELCQRGGYKHHCCQQYKPSAGTVHHPTSTQNKQPNQTAPISLQGRVLEGSPQEETAASDINAVATLPDIITTITFPTTSTTGKPTSAHTTSSQKPTPTTEPQTKTTKKVIPATQKAKLTTSTILPPTKKTNKPTTKPVAKNISTTQRAKLTTTNVSSHITKKTDKPTTKPVTKKESITTAKPKLTTTTTAKSTTKKTEKPATKTPTITTATTKHVIPTTQNPKLTTTIRPTDKHTTAKKELITTTVKITTITTIPTKKPVPTKKSIPTTKPTKVTTSNPCAAFSSTPKSCINQTKCDYSCTTKKCEPLETIVKNEDDTCKTHQCLLDICGCRNCDLAYNLALGQCTSEKEICSKLKFSPEECQRPGRFYAYSGAICKSGKIAQGNCQVEETVLAVNLGVMGQGKKWIDSRNITHFSDHDIPFEDPHKTRVIFGGLAKNKMDNLEEKDKIFYESTVHGTTYGDKADKCLSYKIKLWQTGHYELAVKLGDPSMGKRRHRMFNIRLNGLDVMAEVDVAQITNDRYHAVELFLNFEVVNGGTGLVIKGHPYTKIGDGYVDLGFCYGRCEHTSEFQDYMVAGFSVIKFSNGKDVESKKCSSYKGNACSSRKYACQYNVVTGDVVPFQNCTKTWFTKSDCQRPSSFYAHGGVLCRNNDVTGGDCKVGEVLLAVNLNGKKFGPDSRGITYKSQQEAPPKDPHNSVRRKAVDKVIGVPETDKPLYLTYVYGDGHLNDTNPDNCISWNAPAVKDGLYEISIKTGEFYYGRHGSRTFNVKINDEFVIQEVDLVALAPKGTGIDIILNFEVVHRGTQLHLRGFPLKNLHGNIKLEFCYGGCKTEDRNWMVGAFYLVRFENENKKLNGL